MIHINLLPVREIKRRKKVKKEIIFTFSAFLILIGFFLIIELLQLNIIKELKDENLKLETEKQQYTKVLDEIKKMEEEKKLLTTRIEVINQLKQSSSLTVHVLDEIASLTPSSRMWLKSLSQVESQLGITGIALDDQTVAKYMDDLEGSDYIQSVSLASSAMEIFAERSLKVFSITAQVAMPKK